MTPEMKERVLATVNELIDDDEGELLCWGRDSYEHYSGACAHFELEELDDDGPDPDYEREIRREREWDRE